ncbi:GNAT family N-acetyltransferase [Kamptonema cortianum]|jgi:ribosomal protein S18 acetylase RimI-like enzyme|nr:GNAT family N-acetyltransferase [Geitlerinema splendidum]MDK3160844.1 GNAT family N-acetyltransferase [Kamptonema cortianum]
MTEVDKFTLRSAEEKDLSEIIRLFFEDNLGAMREHFSDPLLPSYLKAFDAITQDKNQALLIVEYYDQVIGTCHLTFMPSLSFKGSWRLNIENIHIDKRFQNQGVGTRMLQKAIDLGRKRGCKIIQLTTNKNRFRAKAFYEKLGFEATHEGMKLYL